MPVATDANFIAAWYRFETSNQIAEHLGLTPGAVRVRATWLRKKGVPLPYHDSTNATHRTEREQRTHERRQEFANIANSCADRHEAARYLGITPDSYSVMASVYRKLGYDIQRFPHPWLEWEE